MEAGENLGFGERPRIWRTSITLPFDLKNFIETRSKQFADASHPEGNVSAYFRWLATGDAEAMTTNRKRKGAR